MEDGIDRLIEFLRIIGAGSSRVLYVQLGRERVWFSLMRVYYKPRWGKIMLLLKLSERISSLRGFFRHNLCNISESVQQCVYIYV